MQHNLHDIHVIIVMLPPGIYVGDTVLSRHTNFGIYQMNEMAERGPRQWHVNHAVHEIQIKIVMLCSVSFVRNTVLSRHTNFGIYQFN